MKKGVERMLYMVIDRQHNDEPLFVGTISEICEYTGKSKNAIYSAISHAEHRGTASQYIRIGYEDEDE